MIAVSSRLARIYPYVCVLASAAIGLWLGSDRVGLPTDYHIETGVTAEQIETLYAPQFATMTSYHAATGEADRERWRVELDVTFAADPVVVAADVEVRQGRARDPLYQYSRVQRQKESCNSQSVEQRRAGLIRCHIETQDGDEYDVIRYTRALSRTEQGFVLATIALDYRELRRRVRPRV